MGYALRSRSYRAQSATGARRSRNASGVVIVIGGPGSRWRARMLKDHVDRMDALGQRLDASLLHRGQSVGEHGGEDPRIKSEDKL
jgi:hypothetical protein